MRANPLTRAVAAVVATALALAPISPLGAAVTTCPQTSSPTSWSGATLDSNTVKSGVVYNGSGARLQLQNGAGQFRSTQLGVTDQTVYAAVGDFDQDGWDDFAGAAETDTWLRIYKNYTFDNPEPDWSDVNAVRTPKFVPVRELIGATTGGVSVRRRPMAVGDFNGDGWPDVFITRHLRSDTSTLDFAPDYARLYLNKAVNDASGNPQFDAQYSAMADSASLSALGMHAVGWLDGPGPRLQRRSQDRPALQLGRQRRHDPRVPQQLHAGDGGEPACGPGAAAVRDRAQVPVPVVVGRAHHVDGDGRLQHRAVPGVRVRRRRRRRPPRSDRRRPELLHHRRRSAAHVEGPVGRRPVVDPAVHRLPGLGNRGLRPRLLGRRQARPRGRHRQLELQRRPRR
jgi:hypothetical protein